MTRDDKIILAFTTAFVVGLLLMVVLFGPGCGPIPSRYATAPTTTTSGPPIIYIGAVDKEYIEDHAELSRLLIRQDGVLVLATVVHGNRCPVAGTSGAQVDVSRAFVGTGGPPSVGDTLGGVVVLSTVIDTLAITAGRFLVTCVAPDTLEGHAWVMLPSLAPCRNDSLVRPLRLIRQHPP